jgi:hypothetical protein
MQRACSLAELRDWVLVEGCRLGASPIEMGRTLDRVCEIPRILLNWDKKSLKTEEEGVDELVSLIDKCDQRKQPLKDLLTWKAARDGNTSTFKRPSREELERRAISLLLETPGSALSKVAEQLGIDRRRLYEMPRVNAILQARRSGLRERRKGFYRADGQVEAVE